MVVCTKCAKEMKCTKTGRPLVWRNNHVYRGDEFTCECGNQVVHSNSKPSTVEKAMQVLEDESPIDMDKKE